ncbi:unnamed protein product [Callosobruchus maculatus]|uniref:Uncharacterized protein n=1 Tax=Callosobruchus maculatus TaxID=64391 RepID=A0A653D814_CALMS|nr:unnamed protein product [Callosobruchus maculatus]
MGMAEVIVILFAIATVGQYLMKWGAYFEQKLTLQDQVKVHKRVGRKAMTEQLAIEIPKPSVFDTLPIQIPKLIWYLIVSLPTALGFIKGAVEQKIENINRAPTPEPEPEPVRVKTVRKRNKFVPPEVEQYREAI